MILTGDQHRQLAKAYASASQDPALDGPAQAELARKANWFRALSEMADAKTAVGLQTDDLE